MQHLDDFTQFIKGRQWFLTGLLLLLLLLAVVFFVLHHLGLISDSTYGYVGTILGGWFGGLFTLMGVIYTLVGSWKENSERETKALVQETRRRVNLVRLLLGELEQNKRILDEVFTSKNWYRLGELSDYVWGRINVELDWMDDKIFKDVEEIYRVFQMINHTYQIASRDPVHQHAILSSKVDGIENWRAYLNVIDSVIQKLKSHYYSSLFAE